jgi:hypothetical protein
MGGLRTGPDPHALQAGAIVAAGRVWYKARAFEAI